MDPGSNKITLRARDEPGMFYAVQTLKALADRDGNAFILPEVTIFDEPRFPYRGMHLDVARNFHSKEEVSKRWTVFSFCGGGGGVNYMFV